MRYLRGIGTVLLTALTIMTAAADEVREAEQNPAITHFLDKIALYASLNGYSIADLSVGNGKPLGGGVRNESHWEPGLWGKALRSDAPPIRYDARKNIRLEGSGAIAFWIKPENWSDSSDPTFISFLRVEAGSEQGFRQLQIIRMGEKVNNGVLAAYFKLGEASNTIPLGALSDSRSPRWHLFVVNWTQSYLEASYNGGRLIRLANPAGAPSTSGDSGAYISIPGGGDALDFRYLIDEVFIFSKPLTNDEVLWLYQTAHQP